MKNQTNRIWSGNEAVEFTQNLEKPDNCTCNFPDEVLAGLTGHRPGCPVFDFWAQRNRTMQVVRYIPLVSTEDFEQMVRIIELVQNNQEFFGDPPAGKLCLKMAADKLEKLV